MNENIENEQVAYYCARAGEYDEWFRRAGRYDRGPEANARWAEEIGLVAETLAAFNPAGDDLAARLAALGWDVAVQTTPTYFLYGTGTPAR